jgi:hypothetical protein
VRPTLSDCYGAQDPRAAHQGQGARAPPAVRPRTHHTLQQHILTTVCFSYRRTRIPPPRTEGAGRFPVEGSRFALRAFCGRA